MTELPRLKADLFRALAHPTRIRLLEVLTGGRYSVQALQDKLDLGQPSVSQHLAALRARDLVTVRRKGTVAHYALRSPLVADLLRVAREILSDRLVENRSMLRELRREERRL
jgi:DNA-binding transcriptional ArsR family regulator